MKLTCFILLAVCFLLLPALHAQNHTLLSETISSNYLSSVSSKVLTLESRLHKKTQTALSQLQKLEVKMKKKLIKTDSTRGEEVFGNIKDRYDQLSRRLSSPDALKEYIPSLDSLNASLKFLQQNPGFISGSSKLSANIESVVGELNGLEKSAPAG